MNEMASGGLRGYPCNSHKFAGCVSYQGACIFHRNKLIMELPQLIESVAQARENFINACSVLTRN